MLLDRYPRAAARGLQLMEALKWDSFQDIREKLDITGKVTDEHIGTFAELLRSDHDFAESFAARIVDLKDSKTMSAYFYQSCFAPAYNEIIAFLHELQIVSCLGGTSYRIQDDMTVRGKDDVRRKHCYTLRLDNGHTFYCGMGTADYLERLRGYLERLKYYVGNKQVNTELFRKALLPDHSTLQDIRTTIIDSSYSAKVACYAGLHLTYADGTTDTYQSNAIHKYLVGETASESAFSTCVSFVKNAKLKPRKK